MTGGKTADRSPQDQPRKSFWDRSGATGSPSRTRTYNLAVERLFLIHKEGEAFVIAD